MALLTFTTLAGGAVTTFIVYYVGLIIYRLYFHPLAKFPGPRIAAASLWYEFYYDVVLRGKFIWRIQEMHKQYGPIIRINPDELHIDDPDYYDEIYGSTTKKRDKYGPWVALAGTPGASFSTVGHDHHKLRRGALNPFFSTKAVAELEPVVKAKVEILASRFEQAQQTGEVIKVDAAFMALTMDVICQYAFANDDNMLSKDDFNLAWKEMIIGAFEGGALLRQFPGMIAMMNAVPDSLMGIMMPSMSLMLDWKAGVRRRVTPILNRTESISDIENASHRTIFHELRDSGLPPEEKTMARLCDEGQILTGAGSETTAKALTTATFYLLEHKQSLEKLKHELKDVAPDADTSAKLSQLPYLSAMIAEALRLSHGVTTRLPRIATDEIMRYKDWEIPFGTPVSSTAYFILMNSKIFPNPKDFKPERWIDATGRFDYALEKKYLVNFGRGSRQCLGMNLAYAEMYLTLATLVRRFDMELFETAVEDVTMVHDFFVAVPKLDSKGVRIKVTKAS
ncbi:cytochrome P450 [Mollisia scopiformis]|uniref:Cytochrome P450 n=1 Tax=Mollisia scopiformis TaxID=149040 RepID=A0A194XKY8_MOLSC|nr:cytochrome P450 [Mollisia scopiformis]KUJ20796.1 cytochrome P450 [Mollisia scopiformis]